MVSEETYKDLESARLRDALGFTYQQKTATAFTDANGKVKRQEQTIMETRSLPNSALIEKILSERIGGPQDWC